MELVYDQQFTEVLERHAPYNNTHIPINEVNPMYIVANRHKNQPNHHFKSTSQMIYNNEDIVNERLSNNYNNNNYNDSFYKNNSNKYSSLANVGKSLVGDTKFIPIDSKVAESHSFSFYNGNRNLGEINDNYVDNKERNNERNERRLSEKGRDGLEGRSYNNTNLNQSNSNFKDINYNNFNQYRNIEKPTEKLDFSTDQLYSKLEEITNMNKKNRDMTQGIKNKDSINNFNDLKKNSNIHDNNAGFNAAFTLNNNNNYNNNIFDNHSNNDIYNNYNSPNLNVNSNNKIHFNNELEMEGIIESKSKEDLRSERKEIDNLLSDFIDNNGDMI